VVHEVRPFSKPPFCTGWEGSDAVDVPAAFVAATVKAL